jgi:nicotinamide-nucleotide amidase
VAIGDELLNGTIADTNSSFVGEELSRCGLRLSRQNVVADDVRATREIIKERSAIARVVVVFGGLGPTSDDKTVESVCALLDCGAAVFGPADTRVREAYRVRGQMLNPHAFKQALYPEKCRAIPNPVGMAPGFVMDYGRCGFYFLPGVPLEMKAMFRASVLPEIRSLPECVKSPRIESRVWKCIGVYESQLQSLMAVVEKELPQSAWLGYRTVFPENHLTLYSASDTMKTLGPQIKTIDEAVKEFCFSRGVDTLEHTVLDAAKHKGARIAFAESCTGGLTANRLSRIPGASEVLWGSLVTYRLEAKHQALNLLDFDEQTCISSECARAMAHEARVKSGAEFAGSSTGYLGPTVGGSDKPAGTIFICALGPAGKILEKTLKLDASDRERTQWAAASYLLDLLRRLLS